ncbi:MAG: response regulator transcription factor [Cyanobacteria bacterium SIG31]|nr:response regulator transcription factor [Cyanobacteria bacterium SIG31]
MESSILIVEDHELTRFGLKTAFETCEYVKNILEVESAESALECLENNTVDLVIMDLGLPGMNGIEATKIIKENNSEIKVVILTSHNDVQEVLNSLKAGANAYCSKEINPKRLTEVVQSVLDGASWFDPSIAHIVLEAASKFQQEDKPKPEKDYGLTSREAQILKLITEGYSNNEIANQLFVSINTTKAHVASILQKLEVDDRLQAALKALKERLV